MPPEATLKKVMGSMTNSTKKKKTHITLWRRLTQILFVFLLNPYFYQARNICFPVLNCWGCPIAAFACPIGALGQFFAHGIFPFLVLGTLILFGAILGRMLCGWICPFGLLQDLLNKIPSPKINLPSFLKYGKYAALLIMVILIPAFWGIASTPDETTVQDFFFCNLCPAGTLESNIPWTLAPPAPLDEATADTTEANKRQIDERFYKESQDNIIVGFLKSPRFWILIAFLVLFVLIRRPFCRGACPIGAIFAIFNKVSFYKMRFDKDKCIECKLCYKICPTSHKAYISPNSPECIRCLECQRKCPTGAIENQYF